MTMPTKIDLSKNKLIYFTNILLVLLLNHESSRAQIEKRSFRIAPLFPVQQLAEGTVKRSECEGAYISLRNASGRIATIKDIDLLIYLSTWLCHAQTELIDQGICDEEPGTAFSFDPENYFEFASKARNGRRQSDFENTLLILHNTILATNCFGEKETEFRLIENYSFDKKDNGMISQVRLDIHPVLANCLSRIMVATILPKEYFSLRQIQRAITLLLMYECAIDDPMSTNLEELSRILGNPIKFERTIRDILQDGLLYYGIKGNTDLSHIVFTTKINQDCPHADILYKQVQV